MNIGHGFDMHRLEVGAHLVIGGVDIPWTHGLAGHSDADVLIHAVCDALLGAAGLGDIGRHFPNTDSRNKNRDSRGFPEGQSRPGRDQRDDQAGRHNSLKQRRGDRITDR